MADESHDDRTVTNYTTAFSVQQQGDQLTIRDNMGSSYQGTVATPTLHAALDGKIPSGQDYAMASTHFTGFSEASKKMIVFTGTITARSLADIHGQTTGGSNPNVQSTNHTFKASHTYTITSANTAYHLSGNWNEEGGFDTTASAISAGSSGTITYEKTFTVATNSVSQ